MPRLNLNAGYLVRRLPKADVKTFASEHGVMKLKELADIIARLDGAAVECDGFVRLATTVLQRQGVSHRVMKGSVTGPLGQIPYHFWIEVDGAICDYRARMWLGPDAPHGIFAPSPEWAYTGHQEPMGSLPESVFFLLAGQSVENVVGCSS